MFLKWKVSLLACIMLNFHSILYLYDADVIVVYCFKNKHVWQ